MFRNPDPEQICALLREVKTIAVVGLSPNPARPAFRIARALQGFGYRIIPVRPKVAEVLGEQAYASLSEVPEKIDLVDVFRAAEHVGPIVDECLRLGLKRIWLQDGIVNEAAAEKAAAGGMTVVMDRCIWRDLNSLPSAPLPGEGGAQAHPVGANRALPLSPSPREGVTSHPAPSGSGAGGEGSFISAVSSGRPGGGAA
ncbi:MAG: CoA-binding protein [Rhodocyclaceae bacterium]|jgi:predicted CoA-binding protein|nr:CoA-binding protein [Rhodocyclaceae bacterium]